LKVRSGSSGIEPISPVLDGGRALSRGHVTTDVWTPAVNPAFLPFGPSATHRSISGCRMTADRVDTKVSVRPSAVSAVVIVPPSSFCLSRVSFATV